MTKPPSTSNSATPVWQYSHQVAAASSSASPSSNSLRILNPFPPITGLHLPKTSEERDQLRASILTSAWDVIQEIDDMFSEDDEDDDEEEEGAGEEEQKSIFG